MYYWNDWYAGWGWMLWFGLVFYFFAILGTWSYSYRTRSHYRGSKDALDLAKERYARGEITRQQFLEIKGDLQADSPGSKSDEKKRVA